VDETDAEETDELFDGSQPETARAREIQQNVPTKRWRRLVQEAQTRAKMLEWLWKEQEVHGLSMQECVRQKAPEVGWSAYQRWKRKAESLDGPLWERLLDQRLPPPPKVIEGDVRLAACMLRRANRSIGPDAAQEHLEAEFGPRGKVLLLCSRDTIPLGVISRHSGRCASRCVSCPATNENILHQGVRTSG
jgi:hypothetical protein